MKYALLTLLFIFCACSCPPCPEKSAVLFAPGFNPLNCPPIPQGMLNPEFYGDNWLTPEDLGKYLEEQMEDMKKKNPTAPPNVFDGLKNPDLWM